MTRLRQKYKNLKKEIDWFYSLENLKKVYYKTEQVDFQKVATNIYAGFVDENNLPYYNKLAAEDLGKYLIDNGLVNRVVIYEGDCVRINYALLAARPPEVLK